MLSQTRASPEREGEAERGDGDGDGTINQPIA